MDNVPTHRSNVGGDTTEQKHNWITADDHPYNAGFQGGG